MKLSIVFPIKNQTRKLVDNLVKIGLPAFDGLGVTYDVIIVPNGCDQEELDYLAEARKSLPAQVKVSEHLVPGGKGKAVRHGFLLSDADYVMFMDADFATDLEAMKRIVPKLTSADCFIGSRNAKGAKIAQKQTLLRQIMHGGSRFLIRHMFSLEEIHDTQCGFKFFRRAAILPLLERQITMGAAFDVEYLYYLKLNGYSIVEVPVVWTDDPDSSFAHPAKTAWKFYRELLAIKKNKKNYLLKEGERC